MTPNDLLRAAIEERSRLEALLRDNPLYRKLEAVRNFVDAYRTDSLDDIRRETAPPKLDGRATAIAAVTEPWPIMGTEAVTTRKRDPRRGAWRKGDSESARIRNGAAEFLRESRQRASGGEIYAALKAKGIVLNSKNPVATVCCRIGRSKRLFDHNDDGYGLVEWSSTSRP